MPLYHYPESAVTGPRHTENFRYYDPTPIIPGGAAKGWVSGKYTTRPTDWNYALHRMYPSGSKGYPLTALITKMQKSPATDPEFHWMSKMLPSQCGAITGVFRDPGLTTAYAGGALEGEVLYFRVSLDDSTHFRDGHEAAIISADYADYILRGKVISVAPAGANSFVSLQLLENDGVAPAPVASSPNASIIVIGSINPEFGATPSNIIYDPTTFKNYTQIFRTPYRISGTARATRYLPGSPGDYAEGMRETLEMHGITMEKAFLLSVPTEKIGVNNMPERTTGGIQWFIQNHGGTIADFRTIPTAISDIPAGATWNEYGTRFLDYMMYQVTQFGGYGNRICFCGGGAISGIQNAVLYRPKTSYTIGYKESAFGINVVTLYSPFGEFQLVVHPLFAYFPNFLNSMFIISLEDLRYRPLNGRDTTYHSEAPGKSPSPGYLDGTTEEYLTECGLELHFPVKFGIAHGIGKDRP